MQKVDSKVLALKILMTVGGYGKKLVRKETISAAEKRQLTRIRVIASIQNGKTND